MARQIADCLEQNLEQHGFEPYRYPSGENKSVHLQVYDDYSEISLYSAPRERPCYNLTIVKRYDER